MRKSTVNAKLSAIPARVRSGSFGGPPIYHDGARKSGIPLSTLSTVKKNVNSNPAPLVAIGGNRLSSRKFSGCSGRSSVTNADGYKKDVRPLHDKVYQQKCIQQLLEFLDVQQYPHIVTAKTLLNPQTKDFLRIFEFLYNFFNPSYCLPTKFEEEIPKIFREVGYPFLVTKSHLLTVGSQHSWPVLLGALHWFRQLVEMYIKTADNQVAVDFDTQVNVEKQYYSDYLFKTYNSWLSGGDSFSEFDAELEDKILGNAIKKLDESEKNCQELSQKLQALESEEDVLTKLQSDIDSATDDVNKFAAFLEDLQKHMDNKREENVLMEKMIQSQDEQKRILKADIEKKKVIAKRQEANKAEYQEMFRQQSVLTQEKLQLENQLKAAKQDIWNYEMQVGKCNEETEALCKDYNDKYREILLDLGEDLHNRNWELRATFSNEIMMQTESLKLHHNSLLKHIKEENRALKEQLFAENESITRMEEVLAETKWYSKEIETKCEEIEKETDENKEVFAKKIEECQNIIKEFQGKIKQIRSENAKTTAKITEVVKELEEAKENLKKEVELALEIKKQDDAEFYKLCNSALDFKEEVEKEILAPIFRNCDKVLNVLKK